MEIDMEHGTICKKQAHICQCIDMHTVTEFIVYVAFSTDDIKLR